MAAPRLSVVIPSHDEEHRLGGTLERVLAWLGERGETYEVIVVDDGSTDGTAALARTFADRACLEVVALPRNLGKGAAVREGFARSRGDRVLFSDADLSTPIEAAGPMAEMLGDERALVIASRAAAGSVLAVRQAWYRETMGKLFNLIVRAVTGVPFHDTQCGFKMLPGEDARALAEFMEEDGFAFDVELILLSRKRGLRVRELPVTWRHVEESRVSPVADSLRMLAALPGIVRRAGRYRE